MASYRNLLEPAGNNSKGGFGPGPSRPARSESSLLWWTISLTLLMALCVFSWFFSIYVFTYPERPFNYNLLTNLDKIEPLKKFVATKDLPSGEFLAPKDCYNRYFSLSDHLTRHQNQLFKQNYILNYKDKERPPVYLKGKFEVAQVRRLAASDVFQKGLVLRCKSLELPNLILELVMPTAKAPAAVFEVGQEVALDSTETFASVIHMEKLGVNNLSVTAVSLVYHQWRVNDGAAMVMESPPERLNLSGNWPILQEALTVSLPGAGAEPPRATAGAESPVETPADK